jgi:hypothetical protein
MLLTHNALRILESDSNLLLEIFVEIEMMRSVKCRSEFPTRLQISYFVRQNSG